MEKTMETNWTARAASMIAGTLGILVIIGALVVGCGEQKLPPPPPPDTGTITITGGAV